MNFTLRNPFTSLFHTATPAWPLSTPKTSQTKSWVSNRHVSWCDQAYNTNTVTVRWLSNEAVHLVDWMTVQMQGRREASPTAINFSNCTLPLGCNMTTLTKCPPLANNFKVQKNSAAQIEFTPYMYLSKSFFPGEHLLFSELALEGKCTSSSNSLEGKG